MKYCQHCGGQLVDEAVVCIHCGRALQNISRPAPVDDRPSGGLNALAFFVPLAGLIMYLVWMNSHPLKAKGIGKWALIGFIVGVVLYVLLYVLTIVAGVVAGLGSTMILGDLFRDMYLYM